MPPKQQQKRSPVASAKKNPKPPVAYRDDASFETTHGHTRPTPYGWMSVKKHPKLREFVEAEAAYAESVMPEALTERIADECDEREVEADPCLPYEHDGYWHYTRETDDDDIICRKPIHCDPDFGATCLARFQRDPTAQLPKADEDEEIVLSEEREQLLHKVDQIDFESYEYNPSQSLVAYLANVTTGDDKFMLVVKDIATGLVLRKVVAVDKEGTPGSSIAWASDAVLYFNISDERLASTKVARLDLRAVYTGEIPCTPVSEAARVARSADGKTAPPYGADAKLRKSNYADGKSGIKVVYREAAAGFQIDSIERSHDETHIGFNVTSNTSCEWHLAYLGEDGCAADEGELEWGVFWAREPHVLYEVHPHPSGLWIVSQNTPDCVQGRVDACRVPPDAAWPLSKDLLVPFVAYDPAVPIDDVTVFAEYVIITVRVNALPRLLLLDRDVAVARVRGAEPGKAPLTYADLVDVHAVMQASDRAYTPRPDDLYVVELVGDCDGFAARSFRVGVESMTNPKCLFSITYGDAAAVDPTKPLSRWSARLLLQDVLACPHKANEYAAEMVWAPVTESVGSDAAVMANAKAAIPASGTAAAAASAFGVSIPIILVYRKECFKKDGSCPMVISTYGSYGDEDVNSFDPKELSILDRGCILAQPFVRGGGQLGHAWHHAGRFDARMNSITDFIACTKFLGAQKYCDPTRIAAVAGSAGGTIMGGILVRAPAMYKVVVLEVPFVDNVTTMLDATRPLTTEEWDEWGNPVESKADYETILSYSPIDNLPSPAEVEEKGIVYPHVLIDSGWNDARVSIQEPASFGAALRRLWGPSAAQRRLLVHRCEFEGGHAGSTDDDEQDFAMAGISAFMLSGLGFTATSRVYGATLKLLKNKKRDESSSDDDSSDDDSSSSDRKKRDYRKPKRKLPTWLGGKGRSR